MSQSFRTTSILLFLSYSLISTGFPVTEVPNPDFNDFDLPDTVDELDMETVVELFIQFENVYQKEYRTPVDQAKARAYFQYNLMNIIQLNRKYSNQSLRFGVNYYTDYSDLQFSEKVANLQPDNVPRRPETSNETVNFDGLPAYFNWNSRRNTVEDVGNQGYCGCSWAYTVSSLLQAAYSIEKVDDVNPSEQQLCDCAQGGNDGCRGGSVLEGLEYVKKNGVVKEEKYQEDGGEDFCNTETDRLHVSSYHFVHPPTSFQIQKNLVEKGPIGVGFKVSNSFRHYKSGIFTPDDCEDEKTFLGWHTVTVVGYGIDEIGHEYWIAKNSWSPSFGVDGFFKFAKNRDLCQFESKMPVYVEI